MGFQFQQLFRPRILRGICALAARAVAETVPFLFFPNLGISTLNNCLAQNNFLHILVFRTNEGRFIDKAMLSVLQNNWFQPTINRKIKPYEINNLSKFTVHILISMTFNLKCIPFNNLLCSHMYLRIQFNLIPFTYFILKHNNADGRYSKYKQYHKHECMIEVKLVMS